MSKYWLLVVLGLACWEPCPNVCVPRGHFCLGGADCCRLFPSVFVLFGVFWRLCSDAWKYKIWRWLRFCARLQPHFLSPYWRSVWAACRAVRAVSGFQSGRGSGQQVILFKNAPSGTVGRLWWDCWARLSPDFPSSSSIHTACKMFVLKHCRLPGIYG